MTPCLGFLSTCPGTRDDGLPYTCTIAMNYGPIVKQSPLLSNPTGLTRVQPMVALITGESEFLSASDSGCLGLFVRVVLDELQQSQTEATHTYEENNACRLVANPSAPTKQMRHIAIRDCALQDWTELNLIALLACSEN
jgi:hypothetical protein